MTSSVAWVALGANLGDPVGQLADALHRVAQLPQSTVLAFSSLYRTAAQGGPAQPDYLNAVVKLQTALPPVALLESLLQIERDAGRVRDGSANAPRTLDLDLLAYADCVLDLPGLQLPHPRLHQRAFVLTPLLELGADFAIAGKGLTDWLKGVSSQPVLRLPTPAAWTL